MKETANTKAYYYFDEAGDAHILGRKGVNLIEKGVASKVFIVGYLETTTPAAIAKALYEVQSQIAANEYLSFVPSVKHTLKMFHANKDCAEVREKVFQVLKQSDFNFYCIVARKKENLFRKKFDMKEKSRWCMIFLTLTNIRTITILQKIRWKQKKLTLCKTRFRKKRMARRPLSSYRV